MATFQDFKQNRITAPVKQPEQVGEPVVDFKFYKDNVQKIQQVLNENPELTRTSRKKQPFFEREGFLQSILSPAYRLGKDFARAITTKEAVQDTERTVRETQELVANLLKQENIDDEQKKRLASILDNNPLDALGEARTDEQILGDIIQVAAFIAPFGISKSVVSSTALRLGAEGAIGGAMFGGGEALSEGGDFKDFLKGTAIGAGAGAVGGAALGGIGILAGKTAKAVAKSEIGQTIKNSLMSVGERLRQFGDEGDEIVTKWLTADNVTQRQKGIYYEKLSPLYKNLDETRKFQVKDALDGKLNPSKLDDKAFPIYQETRKILDDVKNRVEGFSQRETEKILAKYPEDVQVRVRDFVDETISSGAKSFEKALKQSNLSIAERKIARQINKIEGFEIRLTDGTVIQFSGRENYFPRKIISPEDFTKNTRRFQRVIRDAVRRGDFESEDEALRAAKSFFSHQATKGKRDEFWINWMIRKNRTSEKFTESELKVVEKYLSDIDVSPLELTPDLLNRINSAKEEATGATLRYFKRGRTQRAGNIERAREFNVPFYEPDPEIATYQYLSDVLPRLNQAEAFGTTQVNKEISRLISKMKSRLEGSGAPADKINEFTKLVDIATDAMNKAPKSEQVSALIRTLSVPKLSFSAFINLGQGLTNTTLAADFPTFVRGFVRTLTKKGRQDALRSGAVLESVINETLIRTGESQFAKKWLKWTGFSATEKWNRTLSANMGIEWARKQFNKLLKNPLNSTYSTRLTELGIDVEKALAKGVLSPDDMLKAALKFTENTQFRSRPIDLPAFASSPLGKMLFQFKSFSYNQARLLNREFKRELASGNYGRVVRNVIIIATLFPMTGEVLADIQSLATGSKRPTDALDRYFDSLGRGGGLGIAMDAIDSASQGRILEFLVGPSISSASEIGNITVDAIKNGRLTDYQKRTIINQLGITRPFANYTLKTDSKEYEQFFDTLTDFINEL